MMTTSSFLTLLRSSRLGKQDSSYNAALSYLCKRVGVMTRAGLPQARHQGMQQKEIFLQPVANQDLQLTTAVRRHQNSTDTGAAPNTFTATSVNQQEIAKFAQLADEWWNPHGAFRPLHAMNPTRCKFIRSALCQRFGLDPQQPEPFTGKHFVDVGCGGGILTEALARMGAHVTGIEPQQNNIKAAVAHAQADPVVADRTTYLAVTAEELASTGKQFDAVLGLELIEHVEKPADFVKSLSSLTKSEGALLMSTINRTPRGYLLAVLGAEYVAGILPKGTHDWHKFITPEELYMLAEGAGLKLEQMAGMVLNPVSGKWSLSPSVAVNYIAYFSKISLKDKLSRGKPVSISKVADLASS